MFEFQQSPKRTFDNFLKAVAPSLAGHASKTKNGYAASSSNICISFSFATNEIKVEQKEKVYVGGYYEDIWKETSHYGLRNSDDGGLEAFKMY